MKLLLFISALFASVIVVNAQTWTWQHPIPQGNNLNDVTSATDSVFYIVGDYGTIIKTTNEGKSWRQLQSNTLAALYSIRVSPSDVKFVVACGANNTLLVSTDAGATWNSKTPRTGTLNLPSISWRNICFKSTTAQLYFCGDSAYIMSTTDGGTSFSAVNTPFTPSGYPGYGPLRMMVFENNSPHGVAVGDSLLMTTGDGGNTWSFTTATHPSLAGIMFHGVCNPSGVGSQPTFYAAGYNLAGAGIIWESTNDGMNWTALGKIQSDPNTDIQMVPGSLTSIYTTSSDGALNVSTNGGATWVGSNGFNMLNVTSPLVAIAISAGIGVNSSTFCIISHNGRIWTYSETIPPRGQWVEGDSGSTANLNDISMVDDLHGAACGAAGAVSYTKNGGTKWTDVLTGGTGNLQAISFSTPLLGYTCDDAGGMYHTQDGGASWHLQPLPTSAAINAVYSIDDNNAWATSQAGELLNTSNAGGSWLIVSRPVQGQGLGRIFFLSSRYGWIIAQKDSLFSTTDGGASWHGTRVTASPSSIQFNDIYFNDLLNGMIACNGTLFRTTNGGVSWNNNSQFNGAALPAGTLLSGVGITDATNAWCAGSNGLIYFSNDAGATWNTQQSNTNLLLNGLRMVDNANGWAAGLNGSILKYSNTAGTLILPKVIDFGQVGYLVAKDTTITVSNPSNVDITLTAANVNEILVAGNVQFFLESSLPRTIYKNSSDTITIRFLPKVAGANQNRSATMTFTGQSGSSTTSPTITLLGYGANVSISVNGGQNYNFGAVYSGQCKPHAFAIKNTGEIPVTIGVKFIVGLNPYDLTVFHALDTNLVIPVDSVRNFSFDYCPQTQTFDTVQYQFTGVPQSSNGTLIGQGVWLSLAVSPHCFELDTLPASSGTVSEDISIQNTGDIDDNVKYLVRPSDDQFSLKFIRGTVLIDTSKGALLKRGPAQTVTFLLDALKPGKACDTTWIVFENKFGDPLDSVCFHWCYNFENMCDANCQFKCIPVNTCDSQLVSIHNCGDAVTITKVSIGGSAAHAYSWKPIHPPRFDTLLPVPGVKIGVGDSLVVEWYFCPGPADTGDMSDAEIATWYPDSDGNAYAAGACGVLAGLVFHAPACLDFGTVQQAQTPDSIVDSISFQNVGAAADTLSVSHSSSPSAFAVEPSDITFPIPAYTKVPVTIVFRPPSPGVYHDTVTFKSSLSGRTYSMCLNGTSFTSDLVWYPASATCFGPQLIQTTVCDSGIIKNTGSSSVTVQQPVISGSTTQFKTPVVLTSGGAVATYPYQLQSNDSLRIQFCYAPVVPGHDVLNVSFGSSISGVTAAFTRCGDAYATGFVQVQLDPTPATVSVDMLGQPQEIVKVDLMQSVDNTPATSFRGRFTYNTSRLKYNTFQQTSLTPAPAWNCTAVESPLGTISFQGCGTAALKGTGSLLNFQFTPYYGSSDTTKFSFDPASPFKFNVICGGDSTNPVAATSAGVLNFDSTCGLVLSSVVFHAGTYLYQSSPNPATQQITIPYQTLNGGHVTLRIVNTFGVELARVLDADVPAGYREVQFNAKGLPEGMYFYELQTSDTRIVKRMLIVK